MNKLFPTMKIP